MASSRKHRLLAAALVVVAAAACSDDPLPGSGALTATVVSPHGDEGAAVVLLVGEGLLDASALEGRVFSERTGDTLRVVVLREPAGPLRFAVSVEDTTRLPLGSVLEVAGPDDRLRTVLGEYRVEVVR